MNSPYILIPAVIFALMVVAFIIRKGGALLKGSIYGVVSLAFINIASFFTGVSIGINVLTALCAVIFGLPGVAMMLLLKLL